MVYIKNWDEDHIDTKDKISLDWELSLITKKILIVT